jgi:hypothetical protein
LSRFAMEYRFFLKSRNCSRSSFHRSPPCLFRSVFRRVRPFPVRYCDIIMSLPDLAIQLSRCLKVL